MNDIPHAIANDIVVAMDQDVPKADDRPAFGNWPSSRRIDLADAVQSLADDLEFPLAIAEPNNSNRST